MKIVYKNWETDQGLEEAQEKIYTTVSGLAARADQIRGRNIERGNEATKYALTEEGEPLAYVTSYEYGDDTNRVGIGYPWSMEDCPTEAKEKIFNELMAHLKAKEGVGEIRTSVVSASKIKGEMVEFFEKNGFTEVERGYRYTIDLDVVETSKSEATSAAGNLTGRVATEEDIDILYEVSMADDFTNRAFPNEEAWRAYFKDRVLKDGHAVIVFDGDKAVAASAPLRYKPDGVFLSGDEDRIIMRFTSIRNGYTDVWHRLVVEIAKECKSAGWTDIPIRVGYGYTASGPTAIGMAQLKSEIEEYDIGFAFKKE